MIELKYGNNPHQKPARLEFVDPARPPFKVLNGQVGFINLLDALNAWRLVDELRSSLNMPAATSFKHVSPAGAAVGVALDERLLRAYDFGMDEVNNLPPLATAYLRARGADPSSSFGDFVGLSDEVDVATAKLLAGVVSDGVIAPSYEPEALEILKNKKGGKFIVLQADANFAPPAEESREIHGVRMVQGVNSVLIGKEHVSNIVSKNKDLSPDAVRDLILGLITIKYTQSNSVGYALGGQMIGIGAGQQSRVDCTKLAGRKVDSWFLRQHDKVLNLKFKDGVKRQDRINWRLRVVEGDLTKSEEKALSAVLEGSLPDWDEKERKLWLSNLKGVSFVSDAFLPFRDNIDHAIRHGVQYIAHTGGSLRDEDVSAAADDYNLVMVHTGVRLFHH